MCTALVIHFRKLAHRTILRVEDEGENRRVHTIRVLRAPYAGEAAQLAHIANRHGHVAASAAYLEVEIIPVLLRRVRQIELDTCKGELQS